MATAAAPPVPSLNLVSPAIPPEIILNIVQHLPLNTGRDILRLQHVHPRLRAILLNYERSLTRTFMRRELSHASTDFPCCAKFGYHCLAECVRRYDIVDDVMDALSSRQNCYAVPAYNMALANTGLLLLYRVASLGECDYHAYEDTANAPAYARLPQSEAGIYTFPPPRPPHSYISHHPPHHSDRTLPRLRLDPPAHLRPFHG